MILVDANLLIYAHVQTYTQHAAAREWLDGRLNGSAPVGLPWTSLLAFLRITTNPRLAARPLTMTGAWQQVVDWRGCDPVWHPAPSERHADVLGSLLAEPGVHGNLVTDAHLAALAIEHGLTLCSTDGDFARFSGLRWLNPLVPPA
jgi:toxin-antitoxin system PIN domain toxin